MSPTPRIWAAVAVCTFQALGAASARAADAPLTARFDVVFGEPAAAPTPLGRDDVWRVDFGATAPDAAVPLVSARSLDLRSAFAVAQDPAPVRRPVAYVYSEGYELRAKVHKYASYLTLPLFAGQYLLGSKLDEGRASETVRASHAALATTMVGLFGVNTVTGVWNAIEGRKNPNGFRRRLAHSLLMLASDAGFVATGLLAPTNDGGGNRDLHKSIAIGSIGVATAGYLLMFFGQ